ncbi:DUF2630 family protein [Goodfellowiella coeruleoviolacea]|uniref:DUF2630 family protein n=1 Tax=Goodfellowiella coeruleoviolacea TaxID=334858 RepID=A0AAE3GN35_9PSEU|nr:DUF2630 family protein [Goodfellowiella coeruleoviolacea]MCP2169033.1 Protein of unknown function (DUF2630) [Goodfellowiella coeruleoviolacea]
MSETPNQLPQQQIPKTPDTSSTATPEQARRARQAMAGDASGPSERAREQNVFNRIEQLIHEEHELRERAQRGELDTAEERRRLSNVEASLDQCWDLLRQRRALRVAGQDADRAQPRPKEEVERYLQ